MPKLLALLTLCATSIAYAAEGVVFHDLTLRKALGRAEAEGKLVLMYFTTTWCAPCRVMEASTFEDSDVAAWVAEHIVALEVDGDRSGLPGRFDVGAYPTLVYAAPDGEALDRVVGLVEADDFLAIGANVLAGNYGTWQAREPRAAQKGPRLISDATPVLPLHAQSRQIEGHVVVRYTVTEQGRVQDAEVVESESPGVFDRAVLSTISRYRFEPAMSDGKPVAVEGVRRRISFRNMPR